MGVGMGARQSNADRKFVAAVSVDAAVSSGVSAGRVMQPSGFFGNQDGSNVALYVWLILGTALFVAVGGHFILGRYRIPG